MKKYFFIVVLFVFGTILVSCSKNPEEEIKVLTPNGIPYIALGELLGEENITIDNKSADNLSVGLINGEYDIIIAPLNMGVKLYNAKSSKYKLASILTLANTYIVSRKETQLININDLNNKKVIAFGKTSIPGIMFDQALKTNNVDPMEIDYQASSDIAMSLFASNNDYDYLLVSEPYLTLLETKQNIEVNILDLQNILKETTNIENIYQASIFINPDSDVDDIKIVLNMIEESTKKINNNTMNFVNDIIDKDEFYQKQGKDNLIKSLPRSSITYLKVADEKQNIEVFLNKLLSINKVLIGGSLPNQEFYYE